MPLLDLSATSPRLIFTAASRRGWSLNAASARASASRITVVRSSSRVLAVAGASTPSTLPTYSSCAADSLAAALANASCCLASRICTVVDHNPASTLRHTTAAPVNATRLRATNLRQR